MKVSRVTPIPIAYPDPNDERGTGHLVVVRVDTDDGLTGWGETWSRFPEASRAVAAIVDGMADLVVGTDPLRTAATYEELSRRSYWYGEGGIASMAISAVDIALWDIKAQAMSVALVDLLGGARVPSLPAIAAAHPHGAETSEMADEAVRVVAGHLAGYKAGFVTGRRSTGSWGVPRRRVSRCGFQSPP